MANDDRTRIIPGKTPESAAMLASVRRAMAITASLNRLTFADADEVRALFSDLIGRKVDDSFLLIPRSMRPAAPTSASGAMSSSIRTALFMISAASISPMM